MTMWGTYVFDNSSFTVLVPEFERRGRMWFPSLPRPRSG